MPRHFRYIVLIEPYRLCPGHVGEPVYRPVLMSRHYSPRAARKALIRLITGTDKRAQDYLTQSRNSPFAIALRYLVQDCGTLENPRYLDNKYAANALPLTECS